MKFGLFAGRNHACEVKHDDEPVVELPDVSDVFDIQAGSKVWRWFDLFDRYQEDLGDRINDHAQALGANVGDHDAGLFVTLHSIHAEACAHVDEIPVSLMPVDGTFPTGTAAFEKRNVGDSVPVWEPDTCIQCGFVCPHSVIRARYYSEDKLENAPPTFKSAPINVRGFPEVRFTHIDEKVAYMMQALRDHHRWGVHRC